MRVGSVIVPALSLALSGIFSPAAAQSAPSPREAVRPTSLVTWTGARPDSVSDVDITLSAATASGAPRSYQVVSIPIPDALAHVMKLEIEIVPRGEFVVLGPRTRSLPLSSRARLGLTIGIPASALAGRLLAADVRFLSPVAPTIVVPIVIDVTLVRQILLRPGRTAINAQAGNDVFVPFEIVNSGNGRENIQAELTLPSGWSSRDPRSAAISIGPGETIKRRLRLAIPTLSSTGSSFVRVELRGRAEVLASETMTVEVFNSGSIGRQSGPLVTSALSHAADENGRPNSLFTVSAVGALYDSVRIDARLSRGSALGGAASNAFARLGTFQSAASVVLTAPSGQLSLGNAGTSFSDLTGLYPYGEGALLHLQHANWDVLTLGALSMPAVGSTERKPLLGLRGERTFGNAQLSASMSHLADAGSSPRRLDAIGIGAALPSIFGSTLKAEVAERRFQDGSGIGWSSELVRTNAESSEQFRVTHAPGGGDAYARATNELVANVSERLNSRATVSASAWRTTDATAVFSGLKSNGYSLRPQVALRTGTTVAIEMRSYLFDATSRQGIYSAGGGFGSREQQLGISFSNYVRQYYLNTSAYLGNVKRTVALVGESAVTSRTPRNYWTTNAGWSGQGGVVEFQTRIEQTRDAGGFVNQQNMFGVRGEQVVLPWFGGIRGEGDLQRVSGSRGETSAIVRAGLAIPLINGFALKVDVERNSIFRSVGGRVPWIFGARFEHSITVPMLRTPGTSGYVYEDLNGNQHRDAGEPGIAGAIVRRGSETAVADASGKYRVSGNPTAPVAIDEASLPDGWTPSGAAQGDLSVTLSTSAEVELFVAPRSGISAVKVDLSKAHVIARDTAGREWGARMTGPTTATFESLPVGIYTLVFDLSELSEPLVARAPVPLLLVSGKESKSITVTLDPRPIRMWNGSSPRGNGAGKDSP
ncbi:MAG TPA: NEW3 domain-containing protein [Gemmatimonadaceae bacterium]|nr:NEW3 domain-containing protein [Gemmatimonadaceae bacterium]